jgi:hypothetical protein
MCPHTAVYISTIYVSSYYYLYIDYMCPHTTIYIDYVSSYYYTYVLLYMCLHTTGSGAAETREYVRDQVLVLIN